MQSEQQNDRQALVARVTASLRKAEVKAAELRKADRRLVVASISSSAGCTLVAGVTAVRDPILLSGIPGWRLACFVSAGLAFAATVCGGLGQQLKFGDQLSTTNQCIGRLRSLHVLITTGTRDWSEVTEEYAEIAQAFPEFVD